MATGIEISIVEIQDSDRVKGETKRRVKKIRDRKSGREERRAGCEVRHRGGRGVDRAESGDIKRLSKERREGYEVILRGRRRAKGRAEKTGNRDRG